MIRIALKVPKNLLRCEVKMIDELNKYKNKSSVVLLPETDMCIYDSLVYTLKNVVKINESSAANNVLEFLNKSKIEKIYFVGSDKLYEFLLPKLDKSKKICWIFNDSFSNLSNQGVRSLLQTIFEFYDRKLVSIIGCVKQDNARVLKNAGYNFEYINLKIKNHITLCKKSDTVGLLSNDFDPNNNFYNQLAALTFCDYTECKLMYVMKATKKFIKFFNLKSQKVEIIDDVMKDNFVNLYINFTNTDNEIIMKSFNLGVPCLVGNTDFFDSNKYLKETLVIKSDDDINEISEKIKFVKENKEIILNEYKNFVQQ